MRKRLKIQFLDLTTAKWGGFLQLWEDAHWIFVEPKRRS